MTSAIRTTVETRRAGRGWGALVGAMLAGPVGAAAGFAIGTRTETRVTVKAEAPKGIAPKPGKRQGVHPGAAVAVLFLLPAAVIGALWAAIWFVGAFYSFLWSVI